MRRNHPPGPFLARNPYLILAACLILAAGLTVAACTSSTPPQTPRPQATESGTLPPPRVTGLPAGSPGPGGATPQLSPTAREPGSQLGVAPEDLAGLEITFLHVWGWETGEALADLVEAFNRESPEGIRVRAENAGGFGDLSSAVYDAARGGSSPHLVVGFPNQLRSWDQDTGLLVNLSSYAADPVWGITPEGQADFFPTLWERDREGGRRLGLPAPQRLQGLFYNQTWAQELGFDAPPTSPESFREQACAAGQANRQDASEANDGTGGWVIDTSTETVLAWLGAFGEPVLSSDGYRFTGPGAMDALAFTKDLFDDGCAWLSRNRYPNDEFATRRALFIASSTSGLPFQEEAQESAGSGDEWMMIPFPGQAETGVAVVSGPSLAILKSTPEEQLATWIFLRWLLEPAQQARWIQASGELPSRAAAAVELAGYRQVHPQWGQALALLPQAQVEPGLASWGTVRWALSDAAEQVFRLGLTLEQIPALLEELDRTAEELHARSS